MSFRPSGFQLMGRFSARAESKASDCCRSFSRFANPVRAPMGDDELVDGIARRSRHVHVDAGTVQGDRGLGIAE